MTVLFTYYKRFVRQFKSWSVLPFLGLAIAISSVTGVSGQQLTMQFTHITPDNGLSNSTVYSILRDYKDFMWIGTDNGLNRYDGSDFVIFTNIPLDSTSLAGNVVRTIYEDHNKNLFIGTYNGLSLYNRQLNKFLNYVFDKSSPLFRLRISVFRITGDAYGNLWLATSEGLILFNPATNNFVNYKHNPNDASSICNDFLENVLIDSKGRLWASTHKGLDLLDVKTGKFKHITHCITHNDTITDIIHYSAIEDKDGNVWFGSNKGLFCLENKPAKEVELVHYQNEVNNPSSLSHNYVVSLYVDNDNELWIGTENGGINLFDKKKKTFAHIGIDDFNPKSINNESIWEIMQDQNNNMWIGTSGGGINISLKNSDFLIHHKNIAGAPQSLGHNIVKGFLEDSRGRRWVATDGGGLNLFDDQTQRFTRYNTENSSLNSNSVLCLAQGENDLIWMGTWAGGLVNFNPTTNVFKSFTTKNSKIADDNIHTIAKDRSGDLWLGTQNGGLVYFEVKKNRFSNFFPENSCINNTRISVVEIDSRGLLYLGTTISLQIFDPIRKIAVTYVVNPNDSNSISNNYVTDVLIQNDTTVWVATGSGLGRFNPVTKRFRNYFEKDGLSNNFICAITLDKSEVLWVATNVGICRFDSRNNVFKNFSKSDGLQGNEFTDRSILTLKNGQILAGGKNGFNVISPNKIPENKRVPDVVLTDFKIFNQPVSIGAKDSPLTKQISETKKIVLSYKQSVLTFYFAILDYTNPLRNQYAYKMEGFDEDWTFCGNKKEATYTNLSPGEYVFRVKGSNNDGIWNNAGTSITIVVSPPYWQTLWFRSLLLVTIVSLIYLYVKRRIQQEKLTSKVLEVKVKERTHELEEASTLLEENQEEIRAQNEELYRHRNSLEELVEERTKELEAALCRAEESNRLKSSFLANMSHEIRTPMNAILGFSALLAETSFSDEERLDMLDSIGKSGNSLLVIINDILDLSKIQAEQMVLNYNTIDLVQVLADLYKIFSIDAHAKNISLKLNTNLLTDKYLIKTDYVRLRQVITNLVTNALKFTSKGEIVIGVKEIGSNLTLFVKDSGIGISSSFGNSIFDRFVKIEDNKSVLYGGTGLGLAISKSLVELWKGQMWYESVENKGSIFYFTIPDAVVEDSHEIANHVNSELLHPSYPDLNDKTILIAEDQENNFKLLSTYLKKTKARIIWAHNGQEAVSVVNSTAIDFVFMDIKMPILNGIDATIEIRSTNPTLTIVAQTAYAFDDETKSFLDAGMNGYLTKPIREIELIEILNREFCA